MLRIAGETQDFYQANVETGSQKGVSGYVEKSAFSGAQPKAGSGNKVVQWAVLTVGGLFALL
ncbi:MAG: hypothetical protein Q7R39_00500, partial [Dehalococcoidia bacterium]|nr:hypothetical protein [Dehalococcoidia bacterium]